MDGAKIRQFIEVTGADDTTARKYLGAAKQDVDFAITLFLESGEEANPNPGPPRNQPVIAPRPDFSAKKPGGGSGSRFRTFGDIAGNEEEDSEDEPQGYYAGGGEKGGGELIYDPADFEKKKKGKAKDIVESLFDSAKDAGAEEAHEDPSGKKGPDYFAGSGYRLGNTAGEPIVPSGGKKKSEKEDTEYKLSLVFYKNGFIVNDGRLRSYTDPKDIQFIEEIKASRIPAELIGETQGKMVNVHMIERRGEDWTPPKEPLYVAYAGSGMRLGAESHTTVSPAPPSAEKSHDGHTFNPDAPSTTLQIRLQDGGRLVADFNLDSTVGSIYDYVNAKFPGNGGNWKLFTPFPRRALVDRSITIAQAGLQNASLVQN